jgi:hypothetical protein
VDEVKVPNPNPPLPITTVDALEQLSLAGWALRNAFPKIKKKIRAEKYLRQIHMGSSKSHSVFLNTFDTLRGLNTKSVFHNEKDNSG